MIITIKNEIFNMDYIAHIHIDYNNNLRITFANGDIHTINMKSKAKAEEEMKIISLYLKLKK